MKEVFIYNKTSTPLIPEIKKAFDASKITIRYESEKSV